MPHMLIHACLPQHPGMSMLLLCDTGACISIKYVQNFAGKTVQHVCTNEC